MIPVARPSFGEREQAAVVAVLRTGQVAQGQQVEEFERRFAQVCQVADAVAVSSGTAALYLALLAHEIGPGDEVITTPFSFAATANTILLAGATPVFVDIEPDTYTLDPTLVEAAITPQTKAILPVHLYGHPANMPRLLQIAQKHHLIMIEDACQAHAASIDGRPVGSFGTGCFSFYATKNITTGEGGMVTTNDPAIARRVRLLRSHGQQERYRHVALGQNLRMTELQGALGLIQLERLEALTEQRRANAAFLTRHLTDKIQTPIERVGYRHVYHQYTLRVPQWRDTWVQQLREKGVATAVHYPLPIHRQPFYQEQCTLWRAVSANSCTASALPVAEQAAREVLSLPVHPALSTDDLHTIVREVTCLCG